MPDRVPELVHPVPMTDIASWSRSMAASFLVDPPPAHHTRIADMLARHWRPDRAWGVRAGGKWVATLRTETRTLSVPGIGAQTRDLAVDAVTNVTVSATHRRRGLMRSMLEEALHAACERGDPASILIAAEWPIYGRFGYAPTTESADWVLRRPRTGATAFGDPATLRQVDPDELGAIAPAVFDRARRRRPGQIDRGSDWWNRVLGRDGYTPSDQLPPNWLVREGDDGPDGLLGWRPGARPGLLPPMGEVHVWDLVSATDDAYLDIWSYLAGIDLADEVILPNRPVDEPIRWRLQDARSLVLRERVDFTWLRLLDVPAALSARRYASRDDIVLDVLDDGSPSIVSGRYRLRADGEDVQCERTEADADLLITQTALASIYLGAFRLPQLTIAGVAREHTPGALARVDAMFATPLAPWNSTWF